MRRVLTDFNDIADGAVTTSVEGDGPLAVVGERVLLHDGDSEVWGTVTHVDGDLITARVNWATWGPAGRFYVVVGDWQLGMPYDALFSAAPRYLNDVPTHSESAVAVPPALEPVAA